MMLRAVHPTRTQLLAVLLAAAGAVNGCAGEPRWDPADVIVVQSAPSADGRHAALLVRHVHPEALSTDEYTVSVASGPAPRDSVAVARLADTASVARLTRAEAVRLRWLGDSLLAVSCAACGLEAVDVIRREDRAGAVRVRYEGFPAETVK